MISKPPYSFPRLNDDSINDGQVAWWFGGEGAGTTIDNIANPALYSGAMQAGITWGADILGKTYLGNGGATSYVNCGTTDMIADANPFTIAWLETIPSTPGAGIYGAVCFFPNGGAQRFLVLRSDSSGVYGPITVGKGNTTNCPKWSTAPSLASGVGLTRLWIVRGPALTNITNLQLFANGIDFSFNATGAGNNLGSQPGNFNYLGWDGADSKFPGSIHNVRLWARQLGLAECVRLNQDPFAGLYSRRVLKPGGAAAPLYRMFLAQ